MIVIATCSPKNFGLVESYGADMVFDYNSPSCIDDIRNATRKSLKYALDCISEVDTMAFCYQCLGRTGGKYTRLEPFPDMLHTRKLTVHPDWVLGPTTHGKPISWPPPFERDGELETKEWSVLWFSTVQRLLEEKRLRTHPIIVKNGFPAILEGLSLVAKKEVSAHKLVVSITKE